MLFPVSDDVPDLDSGPVLVAAWAAELTRTAAIPPALSAVELERLLPGVVTSLSLAGAAVPLDVERARGAGASLAYAGLVVPDVLPVTIAALGTHLAGVLWAAGAADPAAITPRIVAAVADGYVRTLRSRVHEVAAPHRSDAEVSPALRTSEARFQAVFTHAGTGIILGDRYGRILDVNASFAEMLGYSIEEVRGRDVRELIHPDEVPRMMDGFTAMIETGAEIRRFDRRYLHRDGHVVLTELTSSFVRDDHGEPIMVIVLVVDITQRHELQQRLRHQALHDPLTGLPNRSLFQERLQEIFATPGSRVGLCYFDLDRFKAVNDRLGHEVGDGLLVAVAERLCRIVSGPRHLVARMGGDEFVVLVPEPAAGELPRLAERILAALVEPISVGDHHLSISASIGIVESEVATTTPATLVKSADVTLYWAKSDGRGRWATFDAERNARDMTSYTVLATLGQGVERNEFHVVYQPIVDLTGGQVLGVEALVRWEHPVLGYLTPDQFIGHAEDSGLIVPLGQAVLDQACTDIADWNAAHPDRPLYVSVNLALRQAAEPTLVGEVAGVLERTGLPAELLQLEVTESDLLGPDGRQVDAISSLAAMGIRMALDDFGSGYSNLGYLPRLPLHTLKIAGILVEGLRDRTAGAVPVVANLVQLAHELGLQVTAEGVETGDQAAQLRGCGCDSAQGWLYAKAAPLSALTYLLEGDPPADLP
jgi:diguanylate cyclase (GGDEF)-like protein/PAS domain S-box-containing protein